MFDEWVVLAEILARCIEDASAVLFVVCFLLSVLMEHGDSVSKMVFSNTVK